MKYKLIGLLFSLSPTLFSQSLSAPVAEGVFGGQVGDFETWHYNSDTTYLICATQSPNSLFWAKASRNGSRQNLAWQPVPSADADDGFGSSILNIEIHQTSGNIFFLSNGKVYSTYLGSSNASIVDSMVKEFIIYGDTMALVKNNPLPSGQDIMDFGPITPATGTYIKAGTINLLKNYSEPPQMLVDLSDGHLHLFERGSSPHRYRLMDPFNSMSSSTSLTSAVSPAPSISNIEWRTYGFDQSGTWYVAGQPPLSNPTVRDRHLAWSSDNGMTWNDAPINTPGPIGGAVGNNLVINEISGNQSLFIGNAVEQNLSSIGTWINPGAVYIEDLNRANDGFTKVDPNDQDLVYHSTNIGFGYSTHRGDSIFGWNEGLTAVQVNDIEMTDDFSIGWVASKSGVRKVEDYNTGSPIWSPTAFPTFDGSPYTAVGLSTQKPDTVFVGNQRVYRSTNGGQRVSPSNDGWTQVFSPENAPYNFNRINSHCTALAVSPDSSEIVMAGYSIDFGDQGGCFYSLDGGQNWQQLLLVATSAGQDVDVNDIVFTKESGRIVAYIGLASDPISSGQYGLFRAELGTSGFTATRESGFGATDATIDLEVNNTGETLFLLNYDPGLLPVSNVYLKDLNSGTWSNFAGPSATGQASAITDGDGYVFLSLDEKIYLNSTDGSLGWSLGYAYPVGTEINVLFYDELLVGTGTGLYAHDLHANISLVEQETFERVEIYPNPTENLIHLSRPTQLTIYNLQGQIIYESEAAVSTLVVSNWPSGIYLLNLANGQTEKIWVKP